MNRHKNMNSFRPPSQDPRQISERKLVYENPPRHFIFAQMTAGLKEYYARMNNEDKSKHKTVLENQGIAEEEFSPIPGSYLAGRYEVVDKVGEGQSSILVKAKDMFHPKKRYVAIKILHASYCNLGPQEASCLLHLKKADTLNIANIAHILNTFIVGQHFCIVFEFLSPTPLLKYFQMFPFPSKAEKIKLIRKIAFQVVQCLAVLSSLNIIHSDIKPENILFTNGNKNNIKIIDFGNAIYWVHDEISLYYDSFELQTVFYRAPEVMFGLPFGPQIDMWSLGCVLAELYLGEPLFLATSKDEILEKMQALLGPLPMSPFQSGKYFSNFKKYVSRASTVPGYSKNVVNIMKKLGSIDYTFADFLARLLTFDPSLRLTPVDAARHPFLAPECAFGFFLPSGYLTQESSYSSVLLTPATYPYRPKIDEKIKKRHYSELDLLRVGTQSSTADKANNVVKVLPFNYQEESRIQNDRKEEKVRDEKSVGNEAYKNTVRQTNKQERFDKTTLAGVVSTKNKSNIRCPVYADRRDNPYNESCKVLQAIPIQEKEKSNNEVNIIKQDTSCDGYERASQKGEPCHELDTNKKTCSSTFSAEELDRNTAFYESCIVKKTAVKDLHSATGDDYDWTSKKKDNNFKKCNANKTSKDKYSGTIFRQTERNNLRNESFSVINTISNSSTKVESRKGRRKNPRRGRRKIIGYTPKTRRNKNLKSVNNSDDYPCYMNASKTQSEQPATLNEDFYTSRLVQGDSPVRFINDNDVLLIAVGESGDIPTMESSSSSVGRTSKFDEETQEDNLKDWIDENRANSLAKKTRKSLPRKNRNKKENSVTTPSRKTRAFNKKPQEDNLSAGDKNIIDDVIPTPDIAYTGSVITETAKKETRPATPSSQRTNNPHKNIQENGSTSSSKQQVVKNSPTASSRNNRNNAQLPRNEFLRNPLFRENLNSCSVSSTSQHGDSQKECNANGKYDTPKRPSSIESFFDAFCEDKTDIVSSSCSQSESRTKTKVISKKSNSSLLSQEPITTTSSKRQNETKTEEAFLVTSSNKQISNFQTLSQRVANVSDNEAERIPPSEADSKKNKITLSSGKHEKERKTPKVSVYDTPSPRQVTHARRQLLPGGLSEVDTPVSRTEKGYSLNVLDMEFEETTKTYYKNLRSNSSTEKVSVRRRSLFATDGPGFKNESPNSKELLSVKGSTRTDVLIQEKVRQPRKRKLEYNIANLSGETDTTTYSKSSRQSPKFQKLSDVTLKQDCKRQAQTKEGISYKNVRTHEDYADQSEQNVKERKRPIKESKDISPSLADINIYQRRNEKEPEEEILLLSKNIGQNKNMQADEIRVESDNEFGVGKRSENKKLVSDKKYHVNEYVSSFDEIFRRDDHSIDHDQSLDENYECELVLL